MWADEKQQPYHDSEIRKCKPTKYTLAKILTRQCLLLEINKKLTNTHCLLLCVMQKPGGGNHVMPRCSTVNTDKLERPHTADLYIL